MTDDDGQKLRPNANYKLSKSDDEVPDKNDGLTFYYDRERRLEKAPQSVRDLYAQDRRYRFNLLRPLIADKPRAMVFFTILFICAAIIVLSILGLFDKYIMLSGNKLEITGTVFEDTTIVILRKTAKDSSAYTGAVDIAVSVPVAENGLYRVFSHRVFFTLEQVEEYRFAVPFSYPELLVLLQNEKSTTSLKLKPEQKD